MCIEALRHQTKVITETSSLKMTKLVTKSHLKVHIAWFDWLARKIIHLNKTKEIYKCETFKTSALIETMWMETKQWDEYIWNTTKPVVLLFHEYQPTFVFWQLLTSKISISQPSKRNLGQCFMLCYDNWTLMNSCQNRTNIYLADFEFWQRCSIRWPTSFDCFLFGVWKLDDSNEMQPHFLVNSTKIAWHLNVQILILSSTPQ